MCFSSYRGHAYQKGKTYFDEKNFPSIASFNVTNTTQMRKHPNIWYDSTLPPASKPKCEPLILDVFVFGLIREAGGGEAEGVCCFL